MVRPQRRRRCVALTRDVCAAETGENAAKWLTTIRELVRINFGRNVYDTSGAGGALASTVLLSNNLSCVAGKFWKRMDPAVSKRMAGRTSVAS